MQSKYGFKTTIGRSALMQKIKAYNTKPELQLRKALWAVGLRYRLRTAIKGKPDIVFGQHKLLIFIDGAFWHGFKWKEKKLRLKSNREYWIKKIEGNMRRDREIRRQLRKEGWTVLSFWDHELKNNAAACVKTVVKHLLKAH